MNIMDMIGPIMIGPSSSHTAGVVRIGNVARRILGRTPTEVAITFYGSFAKTYAGHGSDKAIVAGLLGYTTDDEAIRESLATAKKQGLVCRFETAHSSDLHPNTILVELTGKDGKSARILGESIGGGNIIIRKINDIEVEFTGQYDTLIIHHKDTPGAIAIATHILANMNINIAYMKVYRAMKGGTAIMIIETDHPLPDSVSEAMNQIPNFIRTTVIHGLNKE